MVAIRLINLHNSLEYMQIKTNCIVHYVGDTTDDINPYVVHNKILYMTSKYKYG